MTTTNEKQISQKVLIRRAFEQGAKLTTFTGNQIGHTVDFRKIVSDLRCDGLNIKDFWEQSTDGRKYKVYYLEH